MKRNISFFKKIILFGLATMAAACTKNPTPDRKAVSLAEKGVFICNEGNFTAGNATLSFYDPEKNEVQNQIFYAANGVPLGDVAQSMAIWGKKGFIVVNNSGKIIVIDADNCTELATIKGLVSPRYIAFAGDQKAYVSDLYSPSISIIDPTTYQTIGSVYMGTHQAIMDGVEKTLVNGTEQMVIEGNSLYTVSWNFNDKVYRIDMTNDTKADSLTVAKQPNSLVMDKNGKLWVLSDGGYENTPYGQDRAALTRIDAESFTIEKIFEFPSMESSPSRLCINGEKDRLFFINSSWAAGMVENSGIYSMGIEDENLPSEPLIAEASNQVFYGLSVDPQTGDIYLCDAIDYSQRGIVFRYNSQGELLSEFKTDLIPGYFCFK